MYRIEFTPQAVKETLKLRKSENQAYRKLEKLLQELTEHPYTGTGQVERLKHYDEETWARRITDKHRLVYRVYEEVVEVLILSTYGHYDDK